MSKKEEQNFDLLKKIRKVAGIGKKIVEDAIFQAPSEDISISETFVKASELEKLEKMLGKAEKARTLNGIKKWLNEETIPVELVVMDQFWGEFQDLIYALYLKDT